MRGSKEIKMALTVKVNTGTLDLDINSSGVDFTDFSEGNDRIIFTKGNPTVADGQPIPTQAELINAGVHAGSETILDTYLMEDASANLLRDIPLMGNLDSQFVLAFDFDAVTASEPTLAVWDDFNLNTINNQMLGGGTPSSSFIRGVTTTSASSGVNWSPTGTKMAGGGSGHFEWLNDQNGFLTIASTLYANLCVIVPASATSGFSSNVVFVVSWLEN